MTELVLRAHAKINVVLRVMEERADGYHELETIFQSISLHDELRLRPSSLPRVVCDDPALPTDERNLVVRAAQTLTSEFNLPPVEIELRKRIPAGGGLGGGSSDAAATLLGLVRLFDADVPEARLREIALDLGSDVPFFLVGGAAYARGRGEELFPLSDATAVPLLLALPSAKVNTAEAFRMIAAVRGLAGDQHTPSFDEVAADAIVTSGYKLRTADLLNDFEQVVFERYPQFGEWKEKLLDAGAFWAGMSGSGSTIVAAFGDEETRQRAFVALKREMNLIKTRTVSRDEALNVTDLQL